MATKAAALEYNKKSGNAPKVVASGRGELAKKIIEKAHAFDIPVFANETLVNSLVDLEIDQEIPGELYQSVVEVFIWLMKNEKKARR
ncbi:EscU/YscU/HrcU family type III secretion system export apparatus switch protein [bacterium]|nr:EscU/YscU/HrcU family type III secretion system export apparatus switch protein [bacterium]MBU1989530.1 EscU/YscU/HrcU family type III secretion system export apparatus switch protein [bacterium]